MGTFLKVAALSHESQAKRTELAIAKRQEKAAALDREVVRKRRSAAILGAQTAEAAAKGLQLSGSVANISIVDAKRAAEESQIDRINTSGRISALSRRAKSIKRATRIKIGATIIGDFERAAARGA